MKLVQASFLLATASAVKLADADLRLTELLAKYGGEIDEGLVDRIRVDAGDCPELESMANSGVQSTELSAIVP